jgi:hypothetical protein
VIVCIQNEKQTGEEQKTKELLTFRSQRYRPSLGQMVSSCKLLMSSGTALDIYGFPGAIRNGMAVFASH